MAQLRKKKGLEKALPQKYEKLANVSSQSVTKNTGRSWDQWVEILNKAGAFNWSFQEIRAYLSKKYKLSVWWSQQVGIGYEVAAGKRNPGRSLKGDYSIIVTRTIHKDHKKIWKLVTSSEGIALWLKPLSKFKLRLKEPFETESGAFGEIRTMLTYRRIRFSWQEGDEAPKTTVQLLLIPRKNGSTILAFQHEKLREGRQREPLREYWTEIAEQLVTRAKTIV